MTQPFTRAPLSPYAETVIAELAVLRALEAAGKRARLPRPILAQARRCPPHAVHVRFPLATRPRECDRLLSGVWDHLQLVLDDIGHAEQLARACDGYVRNLILHQHPHEREKLAQVLAALFVPE